MRTRNIPTEYTTGCSDLSRRKIKTRGRDHPTCLEKQALLTFVTQSVSEAPWQIGISNHPYHLCSRSLASTLTARCQRQALSSLFSGGTLLLSIPSGSKCQPQRPPFFHAPAFKIFEKSKRFDMMLVFASVGPVSVAATTLLSSSMAEHPAVNRRVVGSSPT